MPSVLWPAVKSLCSKWWCGRSHPHLNAAKAPDSHRLRGDRRRLVRSPAASHRMCSCGTCSVSWRRSGKWRSSSPPNRPQLRTKFWVSATPAASPRLSVPPTTARVGAKFRPPPPPKRSDATQLTRKVC
ncbi:hypothetical protein MTO96_011422 [Rhipicephalus appendiculatus]